MMGYAYDRAKSCLQNGAVDAGGAWALLVIADAIEEAKESMLDLGDLKYISGPLNLGGAAPGAVPKDPNGG